MTGARLAGHPIHPILVGIPIGLCTFSVFADIVRLAGWGKPVWFDVALYAIAGGVVGALLAAGPGRGGGGTWAPVSRRCPAWSTTSRPPPRGSVTSRSRT